jgi:hypothetical protein
MIVIVLDDQDQWPVLSHPHGVIADPAAEAGLTAGAAPRR